MTLSRLITGGGHRRLDEQDVLELAVDPVADSQAVLLGIEMDVGGLRSRRRVPGSG